MSRVGTPGPRRVVGNEFIMATPRLRPAVAVGPAVPTPEPTALPPQPVIVAASLAPASAPVGTVPRMSRYGGWRRTWDSSFELLHRYSLASFALLFLLIGSAGTQVASRHAYPQVNTAASAALAAAVHPTAGINISVASSVLDTKLASITDQTATIMVGDKPVAIGPQAIRSWLTITPSSDGSEDIIHLDSGKMVASLKGLATKSLKAPVNQVTVSHDGADTVVVAGANGTQLHDPSALERDVATLAKTVTAGKGLQLSAPTDPLPFQAVTPAAFDKLIENNIVTKQMYLYEHGQLVKQLPVSAGSPANPTPLGEYHIFSKLASQDMSGYNNNGTKYFQPHVHWINYFKAGGFAVHGVYWHPSTWFGNINSSHGCVGLEDDQAEWVYNWAPIGTTVINHT